MQHTLAALCAAATLLACLSGADAFYDSKRMPDLHVRSEYVSYMTVPDAAGNTAFVIQLLYGGCRKSNYKGETKYISVECSRTTNAEVVIRSWDEVDGVDCQGPPENSHHYKNGALMTDIYGSSSSVRAWCTLVEDFGETRMRSYFLWGEYFYGTCSTTQPFRYARHRIARVFANATVSTMTTTLLDTTNQTSIYFPFTYGVNDLGNVSCVQSTVDTNIYLAYAKGTSGSPIRISMNSIVHAAPLAYSGEPNPGMPDSPEGWAFFSLFILAAVMKALIYVARAFNMLAPAAVGAITKPGKKA